MRLNKYLSNSGLCSRRKADILISNGDISINGNIITELGINVKDNDIVKYKGKVIKPVTNYKYILLNKPKNYICSCHDDRGRKTVLDILKPILKNNKEKDGGNKIFPVGRLDRNTTGLLLLTNDGDLAHKLTHPSSEIIKKYNVILDKPLDIKDEQKLLKGVNLEDGYFKFDNIKIFENRKEINVKMHSGRNRIIRRTFEYLGYNVKFLDRYYYCGLTKENLNVGEYKFISKKEIINNNESK